MSEIKGEIISVIFGKRFFFLVLEIDSDIDILSVYFYFDEKIIINKKYVYVLFFL